MYHWHIITPEYPPQTGGVADFTRQVAAGLAETGDTVNVWAPGDDSSSKIESTGPVHRSFGAFRLRDLWRVSRHLKALPRNSRLLVQWVPHGYGWRSMNLPFCIWLWLHSFRRSPIELVVHEPFLSFREGSLKQDLAAAIHRLMLMFLLRASTRIWMSTPAWENLLRPYSLGRNIQYQWVPVSSNIPVRSEPDGAAGFRRDINAESKLLVGHFSTYSGGVTDLLHQILPPLLKGNSELLMVLLGQGGDTFMKAFGNLHPNLKNQLIAPGRLSASELSARLSACDVIVQPYPDGVTHRRTSIMAALSHGLPAVTTLGHLSEPFWKDCDAVAVAPANRPSEFINITRNLLANPMERKRLKLAAQSVYRNHFDISLAIERLRAAAHVR